MAVKRVKNHGNWRWRVRVVVAGVKRVAYKATRGEARDAEAALRADLKAQAAQVEHQGQRPATLRQLLELYVQGLRDRGKSDDTCGRAEQTALAMERLVPELLDRGVAAFGDRDVFAFRAARASTAKPGTVNRDLRTLRAALKKGRLEYRFPPGAFFREDDTRVRWLRPEEEILVFETMTSPIREVAKLAALTLMRQGELLALRREHVHLEQGVVMLPRAKAGARPVILSAEAQKILRGHLDGHASEWAFPGPDGRPYSRVHVSRVFRKAARAAGLKDFRFHDLRHHGATMALNKGFTAPIVMALGGWKTEAMMRRYAAVTDQTLRAAAEAVSGAEMTQSVLTRPRS